MRYLVNENIPRSVVRLLREAGDDAVHVAESMPGRDDAAILARAMSEHRVLVTQDKDFGELSFRSRLPASCGVLLLRITPRGRDQDVRTIFEIIRSRDDWSGAFWIVSDDRIRRRPLP